MSANSDRIIELFCQAKAKAAGEERERFLAEACANDPELREQVESLLRAQDAAGEFLQNTRVVLTPEVVTEKPGDRIGHYKLLEKIGEGGMGTVWMAERTETVRLRVALKVIKQGMDSGQVLARFENERHAVTMMDHPNIAKLLDAGATSSGRPYFVMELIKGVPIIKYCDEKRLSIRERLELFMPVCQAIQHAHQKGIIHRDIKPSNVLVALHDDEPVPKVIDFGIAKAMGQQLTERTLFTGFGEVVGTLEYMSPEQAELNQLDIDTRSDIYSLGVLLYELLTGTTPLTREAIHQTALDEILRRIREQEPPKPSTRLSDSKERLPSISAQRQLDPAKLTKLLRGDLDQIVMKCLEKSRTRRYATANEVAININRHLTNEPVDPPPPTIFYRFQKLVRRNKVAFAAAAGFAVLLTTAAAVSTGLALWANRERANADAAQKAESREAQRAVIEAQRARIAEAETKMTLSASHFQQAARLIGEDNWNDALAYLAASVSANPSNHAALTRLATLLSHHSWRLPELERRGSLMELSPDGRRFITATTNAVRLWDAQTGRLVLGPLEDHGSVARAQLSADGTRILTVSVMVNTAQGEPLRAGTTFSERLKQVVEKWSDIDNVRLWDAQTGQLVAGPLEHLHRAYMPLFSPDGKRFVTITTNATRLWLAETGKPAMEPLKHEAGGWPHFSSDGKRFVTVTTNGTTIWDVERGQVVAGPLKQDGAGDLVSFSPDTLRFVTIATNMARLWDTETGQLVAGPLEHESPVSSAKFTPDGRRFITTTTNRARLWDARSGQPVNDTLRPESRFPWVQFSPDGRWFATRSEDQTLYVWDAETGRPVTTPLKHKRLLHSVDFSPDKRRIVTVVAGNFQPWLRKGGTVHLWDVQPGQLVADPLKNGGWVYWARFSPDGKQVFAGSDKVVCVWDAESGRPAQFLTHSGASPMEFSPQGQRGIVSGGGVVRQWSAPTAGALPLALKQPITSGQFSPDGRWILATSKDRPLSLWDSQTSAAMVEPWKEGGPVSMLVFSPDGKRLVTATTNTVRVWNAQTFRPVTALKHDHRVAMAKFTPDGVWLLTVAEETRSDVVAARKPKGDVTNTLRFYTNQVVVNSTVIVWNPEIGQQKAGPLKYSGRIISVQFSADGRRFLTLTTNSASVWETQTGRPLGKPLERGGGKSADQFSPDGRHLVRIDRRSFLSSEIRLWDVETGQATGDGAIGDAWQGLSFLPSRWVKFSPDGTRLVTVSGRSELGPEIATARLWNVQTGQTVVEYLPHYYQTYAPNPQFSPDGKRLLTLPDDNTVQMLDAQTGQPMGEPLKHNGWIVSVQFSRDGSRFLTATTNSAFVWDTQTGQALTEPFEHQVKVESAQFSPDGKRILTVSADETGRVWDVAPSKGNSPQWLLELAEAISGFKLNQQGALETTSLNRAETIQRIRQRLSQESDDDDWAVWGRWFLADPSTRTISPFSKTK